MTINILIFFCTGVFIRNCEENYLQPGGGYVRHGGIIVLLAITTFFRYWIGGSLHL